MKPYEVLIVDDDINTLNALEKALQDEYSVLPATNGEDALCIMEERDVALAISDHQMLGMSGVELLEELSKKYPDTVRMIITGHAEERLFMDAINLGHIYGFITKPWEIEDVRDMARKGIRFYERNQALREPHVRALLSSGILSAEQLEAAMQTNRESGRSIGWILAERGAVPSKHLKMAMKLEESEGSQLGEVLVERGIISATDLEMAREEQARERKNLTSVLIDLGYADEEDLLSCYVLQLGIPCISLTQFPRRPELAEMLPSRLAYKYSIVPVDAAGRTLVVAASEPLNEEAERDIEEKTGKRVMAVLANRQDIKELLEEYYDYESISPNPN